MAQDHDQTSLNTKTPSAWEPSFQSARTLFDTNQHSLAETNFHQALRAQSQTLGPTHPSTLQTKHWLARTLYAQAKYPEAEQVFRETVLAQEEVLDAQNRDALETRYWYGQALCDGGKLDEAEEVFRELLGVWEGLGKEIGKEDTEGKEGDEMYRCRHCLVAVLYKLGKFEEVQEVLGKVA